MTERFPPPQCCAHCFERWRPAVSQSSRASALAPPSGQLASLPPQVQGGEAVSFRVLFRVRAIGLYSVNYSPRLVNEVLFCNTLHIIGGDLLDLVQTGEHHAPVAIHHFVEGQLRSKTTVAVELADETCTEFRFHASESCGIDLFVL